MSVAAKKTGVYRIRNTANGKVYIGSAAVCMRGRWVLHRSGLRLGTHHNPHLQAAWRKYGEDAFVFEVIEFCGPQECVGREQHWIDQYQATDPRRGYNVCPRAGNSLGRKYSDESKAKLSAVARRRAEDPVWRAQHSARLKGRKVSEEVKAKIAAAHEGKPMKPEHLAKLQAVMKDPEVLAKMSAAQKARPPRPPMTAEQRAKIAETLQGRKQSAETVAKKVASLTGRKRSAETRAKMAAAAKARHAKHPHPWLGKKHTEETRKKMSAAHKAKRVVTEKPAQHPEGPP